MDDHADVIRAARARVDALPEEAMAGMREARPPVVHEKPYTYPSSAPETYRPAPEVKVEWGPLSGRPVRLYVHIPWCVKRCSFCFYELKPRLPTEDEFAVYAGCVRKEIELHTKARGESRLTVEVLCVGGGTPTSLTAEQIKRFLGMIHETVDFADERAPRMYEASPGTLTPEKAAALRAGGVNRVSLGIQSFDDKILKDTRRDHDAAGAVGAYRMLRDADIPKVCVDLLLALPGQTLESCADSVAKALELAPSAICFLDLRVGPGSPLHAQRFHADFRANIYMRAIYQAMLKADRRYFRTHPHRYHVHKEPTMGRHPKVPRAPESTGYDIGTGVAAYSHVGDVCFTNAVNPRYREIVESGRLPIAWSMPLQEEDKVAMRAVRSIVDYSRVPLEPAALALNGEKIEFLKKHRLIDSAGRLTDDGCLFKEEISYLMYPQKARVAPS